MKTLAERVALERTAPLIGVLASSEFVLFLGAEMAHALGLSGSSPRPSALLNTIADETAFPDKSGRRLFSILEWATSERGRPWVIKRLISSLPKKSKARAAPAFSAILQLAPRLTLTTWFDAPCFQRSFIGANVDLTIN